MHKICWQIRSLTTTTTTTTSTATIIIIIIETTTATTTIATTIIIIARRTSPPENVFSDIVRTMKNIKNEKEIERRLYTLNTGNL